MNDLFKYSKSLSLITHVQSTAQGFYQISGKTSCRQISLSLEAAGLGITMMSSLRNLTGILAAQLPMCLSNFRAIEKV